MSTHFNSSHASQQPAWLSTACFYQFYPLGFARGQANGQGLKHMTQWLDHVEQTGFNALYLSPIWASEDHGYETNDYVSVDKRLGSNQDLIAFIHAAHAKGIKVVLDGVFNHVGRGFFAFQDLLKNREKSAYKEWFVNVDFNANNGHNDGLTYEAWEGHETLVQLNVKHPDVSAYLLNAVDVWVKDFDIDGIRLDAADCVADQFWQQLRSQCNQYKIENGVSQFWLMGEIIHGDYNQWLGEQAFHSVTNYEAYKGAWSSFNDANMHEIAHSLKRQFESGGVYEPYCLYNFVDNHDVARIASVIKHREHLAPLHVLMYTMPGIPSVYYGSEWLLEGKKDKPDDWHLRPTAEMMTQLSKGSQALKDVIAKLNALRKAYPVLSTGTYQELTVESEMLAFKRSLNGEEAICIINAASEETNVSLQVLIGTYYDALNDEMLELNQVCQVGAHWARVLIKR